MNIALIDIDSKIPNLALMKLSAYHKKNNNIVDLVGELDSRQYDVVYASKIFNDTSFPNLPSTAIIGGTGSGFTMVLPDKIEHLYPDYSLYNCDYAIGFTSRGCNRKCPFCVVPEKEGRWRPNADIYEFWRGQDKIMLLDNSLNTDHGYFKYILNQLIESKARINFSQGLDIRYLNDEQAELLTHVRLWKRIHFAWDLMPTERAVRSGVRILEKYSLKNKAMFYVLIGHNTTHEEDLYRVEELRSMGVDPFVMPYDRKDDYQRKFARYVNHKAVFKSIGWDEYVGEWPRREK